MFRYKYSSNIFVKLFILYNKKDAKNVVGVSYKVRWQVLNNMKHETAYIDKNLK